MIGRRRGGAGQQRIGLEFRASLGVIAPIAQGMEAGRLSEVIMIIASEMKTPHLAVTWGHPAAPWCGISLEIIPLDQPGQGVIHVLAQRFRLQPAAAWKMSAGESRRRQDRLV